MAGHEVTELPGWAGALPSRHFSGFLEVHAAQWHYHLTEAEVEDPARAPLVLYCSGGPGGSSFSTGFRGFGQFRLDERSLAGEAYEASGIPQLQKHEYGWTTKYNVLAWECPPGVGFSFCADPAERMGWTDQKTAEHSATFLEAFVAAHPAYQGRQFVVLGASYAGIYVPMLAEEILKRKDAGGFPLELTAIGAGNSVSAAAPFVVFFRKPQRSDCSGCRPLPQRERAARRARPAQQRNCPDRLLLAAPDVQRGALPPDPRQLHRR